MNVTIKTEAEKTLIVIEGRVDTTNAKEFEKAISEVIESPMHDVEVDCEKLTYISSSGLRVFLVLQKSAMAKQGKLVLRHLQPTILEVFKMTGFTSIFTIA